MNLKVVCAMRVIILLTLLGLLIGTTRFRAAEEAFASNPTEAATLISPFPPTDVPGEISLHARNFHYRRLPDGIVFDESAVSGNTIYFYLRPSAFWRENDEAYDLAAQLMSSLRVSIDRITLDSRDLYLTEYSTLSIVQDSQGQHLGSFGGMINVCFDYPKREGIYSATVDVYDTAAERTTYTWGIQIYRV